MLELAKALSRLGVEVDIYTRWFDSEKSQIDPVAGSPGVRVIRIEAGTWEFIPKEFIYDVLPDLAKNMIAFIKDNGIAYDLYHGHYVNSGIVTLDVAKAFEKLPFFTAHSLGAWKREQMLFYVGISSFCKRSVWNICVFAEQIATETALAGVGMRWR